MKKLLTLILCVASSATCATGLGVESFLPTKTPIAVSSDLMSINDNIKKTMLENVIVDAGGYGGNANTNLLYYTGMRGHLPSLKVSRNALENKCYLENSNARLFLRYSNQTIHFPCLVKDRYGLYWNDAFGAINGGYSPENDTLYAADIITHMFHDWYGNSPVQESHNNKAIDFRLHFNIDNAYPSGDEILIGDGDLQFYPLTSFSVVTYLVGQVFTQQHSQLNWHNPQSGGINIAFSCMTAMAAEYYATQKNSWQVGSDVMKNHQALHYLDQPSKNCHSNESICSIETLAQFKKSTSNYEASGLFNHAFYLLATANNWNTHKAYDVFMQANRHHWKSNTGFHSGACDVVKSAKELGYDAMSVMIAFSEVGIDTRDCNN